MEDNPDDEMLTIRALKKNHFNTEVVVLRDGVEALNFLFCRGEYQDRDIDHQPILILLDLKLPKVDGIEVLQKLHADERMRLLPVVVLTTSNEQADITASYQYGAKSYVRKPVDFKEFTNTIGQLGKYWLTINNTVYGQTD